MDSRLQKINELITSYSLGKFNKKLKISKKLDEIDAFISSVNMLGEELNSTTITKNYFTNIFDSITEPIIITNKTGVITDINASAKMIFSIHSQNFPAINIDKIVQCIPVDLFRLLRNDLKKGKSKAEKEALVYVDKGRKMPVVVIMSFLKSATNRKNGYIVTIRDISVQKESKDLIIKTIIDTQEKERLRFSQDIHDSLGQQLSAFKFIIGTYKHLATDHSVKKMLGTMNDAIIGLQAEMRNICFNLMPKTLETVGLVAAIQELCTQLKVFSGVSIQLNAASNFSPLPKPLETSLFRVAQEFVHNALQHGKASRIKISLQNTSKEIFLNLKDNGIGFNLLKIQQKTNIGSGLKNIHSRVEAYGGTLQIQSGLGKGTSFLITIPIQKK